MVSKALITVVIGHSLALNGCQSFAQLLSVSIESSERETKTIALQRPCTQFPAVACNLKNLQKQASSTTRQNYFFILLDALYIGAKLDINLYDL